MGLGALGTCDNVVYNLKDKLFLDLRSLFCSCKTFLIQSERWVQDNVIHAVKNYDFKFLV